MTLQTSSHLHSSPPALPSLAPSRKRLYQPSESASSESSELTHSPAPTPTPIGPTIPSKRRVSKTVAKGGKSGKGREREARKDEQEAKRQERKEADGQHFATKVRAWISSMREDEDGKRATKKAKTMPSWESTGRTHLSAEPPLDDSISLDTSWSSLKFSSDTSDSSNLDSFSTSSSGSSSSSDSSFEFTPYDPILSYLSSRDVDNDPLLQAFATSYLKMYDASTVLLSKMLEEGWEWGGDEEEWGDETGPLECAMMAGVMGMGEMQNMILAWMLDHRKEE